MVATPVQPGQKLGRLTLLAPDAGTGRHPRWRMLCDCGAEKTIDLGAVRSGRQVSCGCFRLQRVAETRRLDLTGARVGMLVVRGFYQAINGATFWMCQCDCGCGYIGHGTHLSRGRVQSCGCLKRKFTEREKTSNDLTKYASNSNRRALKAKATGRVSASEIRGLMALQKSRCGNCGCSLKGGYHRDHRVALSKGGSNDISNIELLCPRCNVRKHAKDPVQWANENGRLI